MENRSKVAGLHISGPNSHKTAVVIIECSDVIKPLKLAGLYEKIGSQGKLFSDDRLVEILQRHGPFAEVFVDCPLSVPPCVACERPVCPGVIDCEDVAVAYMLSLAVKIKARGARKKRPINPQSQRLWDVLYQSETVTLPGAATYSANLAPLVTRARTLQRRLNGIPVPIALKETSVIYAMEGLCQRLGIDERLGSDYRNFESGIEIREAIVGTMVDDGWLTDVDSDELLERVCLSAENFHGFITALMAALYHQGMCHRQPKNFLPGEGWVHLPQFACDWPTEL